nr:hypothetical protein CFP56_22296 [Quercus suber]
MAAFCRCAWAGGVREHVPLLNGLSRLWRGRSTSYAWLCQRISHNTTIAKIRRATKSLARGRNALRRRGDIGSRGEGASWPHDRVVAECDGFQLPQLCLGGGWRKFERTGSPVGLCRAAHAPVSGKRGLARPTARIDDIWNLPTLTTLAAYPLTGC